MAVIKGSRTQLMQIRIYCVRGPLEHEAKITYFYSNIFKFLSIWYN